MSIYNILLFISYLCLATGYNAVDIYEDAYYEDDYEENNEKDKPRIHGYYKNVGGGVLKIKNMLVDEAYVNETIDYYDCVPRRLINVLKVEEEEVEEFQSIESQIQDLKKKMTEINVISNAIAEGIDPRTAKEMGRNAVAEAEEGNNTKSAIDGEEEEGSSKKREKRVSFREKQTMKMQEKREKEAARELVRPKYRLGADCESLVCGSCKVIVDEFAFMVHAGIDDQEKRYIEDLTVDFCQSKSIAIKYNDMVHDICKNFEEVRTSSKHC